MLSAVHMLLYSRDPDADRAFLRDVLGWPHVDAGGPEPGWLIFKTPPGEVAVHPTDGAPTTELHLMCEDIAATVAELRAAGAAVTDPENRGWGISAELTLPGGGTLGVYQPRHATAFDL
jgi:predicted enzyme related to lactoylglutathione lyase